jgi:hypothetical protein
MSINANSITRPFFRGVLTLKQNAPTIAFVGGIAGVVTSTVLACRATLKLSEELPQMKEQMDDVRALNADNNGEYRSEVMYVYTRNAMTVARLYAPSVVLGVASVTALTGSHIALNRRNAGLTAAYAGLSKAYDDYRERVRAELGEDTEKDMHVGVTKKKIKDEHGKKVVAKIVNGTGISVYAKMFDAQSTAWVKNPEFNRIFLQCQQDYFNHRLIRRGHVFLNEVYDALGFEHTEAGSLVGWRMSEEGDNYIDFGMFEAHNAPFINNREPVLVLDFNVDGVIYDKI